MMQESAEVIKLLFTSGVINILVGLIGLIVIGFLILVGVIAWLAITQAPKFNQHLSDITSCLRDTNREFTKILEEHSEVFEVVKKDLGEVKQEVNIIKSLVSRS